MSKQYYECAGLTDAVVTVKHIIQTKGSIDLDTLGGTAGNVFYYMDVPNDEGVLESIEIYGLLSFISKLIEVFASGKDIPLSSVWSTGGRSRWITFEATTEEQGPTIEPTPVVDDTPPEPEPDEDVSEKEIVASAAAIEMAKINNIDLSKVTGTGKDGKINKPDVVKYMHSAG